MSLVVDELNSRVGRVSERPFTVFNFYVGVSRRYGLLSAILIAYLEYLIATDPPHGIAEEGGVKFHFYALPLQELRDDLSKIMRSPVSRQQLQRKLNILKGVNLIERRQLNEAPDTTWFYAIHTRNLERLLTGEEDEA